MTPDQAPQLTQPHTIIPKRSHARSSVATALVAVLITAAGLAVAASPAWAKEYHSWTFCDNYLAPDGTCPPSGSSQYGHQEEIQGNAGGPGHETCIDYYYENIYKEWKYSAAECMLYEGETALEWPEGRYGYPRAWNGGKVEHTVWGWQYYYTT